MFNRASSFGIELCNWSILNPSVDVSYMFDGSNCSIERCFKCPTGSPTANPTGSKTSKPTAKPTDEPTGSPTSTCSRGCPKVNDYFSIQSDNNSSAEAKICIVLQGRRKIAARPCQGTISELWTVDNFGQFRNKRHDDICLMKKGKKLVPSAPCGRAELMSKNYSFSYSMFMKTLFWTKEEKTVVTLNGDGTKVSLRHKSNSNNDKWIITTK